MATLKRNGHGQIELTRVSFTKDGNIEAQCFATEDMDNGAIVVVNKAAKEVSVAKDFTKGLLGVNYTTEKNYNQFEPGRKHFQVKAGEYPRVGYLKTGDVFTTNVMISDSKEGTVIADDAVKNGLYWTAAGLVADKPTEGLVLQVVEITDTADGQDALKIQVL
jgi:hypothetical protein